MSLSTMGPMWGLPKDVSLHGWRIDSLFFSTTWFLLAIFSVCLLFLLWACFFHRDKAQYQPGSPRFSVLIASLLSLVLFFAVEGNALYNANEDAANIYLELSPFADKQEPDILRLEVNARQWMWQARYAGTDGEFSTKDDIVVNHNIRVPEKTPILVQLTSTDVVHNFNLPMLRTKFDATPGYVRSFWFQAQEAGRYEIACAQHCGVNHYKMRGELVVLSTEEFSSWLAKAAELSLRAYDDNDSLAKWGWPWKESH